MISFFISSPHPKESSNSSNNIDNYNVLSPLCALKKKGTATTTTTTTTHETLETRSRECINIDGWRGEGGECSSQTTHNLQKWKHHHHHHQQQQQQQQQQHKKTTSNIVYWEGYFVSSILQNKANIGVDSMLCFRFICFSKLNLALDWWLSIAFKTSDSVKNLRRIYIVFSSRWTGLLPAFHTNIPHPSPLGVLLGVSGYISGSMYFSLKVKYI